MSNNAFPRVQPLDQKLGNEVLEFGEPCQSSQFDKPQFVLAQGACWPFGVGTGISSEQPTTRHGLSKQEFQQSGLVRRVTAHQKESLSTFSLSLASVSLSLCYHVDVFTTQKILSRHFFNQKFKT